MKRKALIWMSFAVLLIAGAAAAAAQVEVRVHAAPPALRTEVIPPAPGPGHYWIGGHWGWEHGRWNWAGGHWEEGRAGQVWVRPEWARAGGDWVFRPGRWTEVHAPREFVDVVTETTPPPPRVEVVTVAPSPNHFWIPGYWRWDGRAHVWVGGRWELPHAGMIWVPAHWVRIDGRWHMRGGHWQPA